MTRRGAFSAGGQAAAATVLETLQNAGQSAGQNAGENTGQPPLRLKRPREWLLGGLLLCGLIALVQAWIGWPQLLAPWLEFPPLLLAGLLGLSAGSYLARAARVQLYFAPLMAGVFPTTLRLSVLHTTANVLLPMRLGELVFPWLMRRYFGQGLLGAGVSLVWIRLLDLHFLGLIGWLILWLRAPSPLWLLAMLLWLGLLLLVVPLARRAARLPQAGPRWQRTLAFLAAAAPQQNTRLAGLYAWTALCWAAKFIAFAMVLGHFLPIDFWQLLAGVMGAELSSVLPFHGIGGSGSYELATMAALVPLGVTAKDALAGAVNLHLFMLGVCILFGLLALALPIRAPQTGESCYPQR
ncbi:MULTISPECIES: lysylphosphatidylglycerol synthase domain-containing protein [Thiorhodovibrio]|uniref:lysylphosphatidylglycerol synthase domain-containing protein n=1 Tax=Thiorhodovibrio TaxID=61593 RepID=UPI001914105F|nr:MULTISPECIES: lysylphosphatidylglycerol synthase domain-containing protein [Thiorhodovibrio]MBK5968588.1 hypothetical protein [Thiorhodovibrio winogradskyi]WPL11315.1 hypothetical protein Thiosp_01048 [Thiorhodovibrio litoralis]